MASKREIFAKNLRRVFESRPITRAQLADYCDVSLAAVGDWLNAKSVPRFEKISMIAKVLGVTEYDLISDFDNQDMRQYGAREIADIARELYEDPEARSLYEEIRALSPDNKKVVAQLVKTIYLSQKN